MQRRTFFTLIILTAVISVAATLGMLSVVSPQQSGPVERLVTFVVQITSTPGPTQTPYVITATLPDGVVVVPTGIFETPNLTRSPVPTIDPNAIGANVAAQGTVSALPANCIPHVVQEGDTPFGIAEQYGANGFTLMAINGLSDETATQLQIGDVLIVPLEGCALQPPPTAAATQSPTAPPEETAEAGATRTRAVTLTPSPSPTITLAPTAANAQIEIVEVISPGDVTAEAVRIRNLGNTVNVTGWTLSDSQGNIYTFPEQLIFSNAQVTIYTRSGQNTPVVFFWGRDQAVWSKGDVVTLADAEGRIQATQRLP